MGLEDPGPGSAVFQAMFSLEDHLAGRPVSARTRSQRRNRPSRQVVLQGKHSGIPGYVFLGGPLGGKACFGADSESARAAELSPIGGKAAGREDADRQGEQGHAVESHCRLLESAGWFSWAQP